MKNRSRSEIIKSILVVTNAGEGASRNRLMYKWYETKNLDYLKNLNSLSDSGTFVLKKEKVMGSCLGHHKVDIGECTQVDRV
jgi:predicted transcriptional regulator